MQRHDKFHYKREKSSSRVSVPKETGFSVLPSQMALIVLSVIKLMASVDNISIKFATLS